MVGVNNSALCGLDRMGFESHPKALAHCAKNRGKIVHAGIALFRKHPVQALARAIGFSGETLEPDRSIDQIAQDKACDMGFAVEEGGRGFVEHGFGEGRIARGALLHRFLEISCQRHLS